MNKPAIAIVSMATLATGVLAANSVQAHSRSAWAVLALADGTNIGTVKFEGDGGHTSVRARLTGVPGLDAFHGFHIHANDIASNGDGCLADPSAASSTWFVSADGHYNPTTQTHSHHVGDMPVVYVNSDGSVETRFNIDKITLSDLNGKVVVLHAGADNFNNIPLGPNAAQYTANSPEATAASAKTGNAGDRIACGVITIR
jgi:superoxide dismutase, Cu-Zn family